MKRYRQTFEEIEASLSRIESSWMDVHASEVIAMLKAIPIRKRYQAKDIMALLDGNFKIGSTVIRLFMDQSKDEFIPNLTAALGEQGTLRGSGVKCYKACKDEYVDVLIKMGLADNMTKAVNRPLHWFDTLTERLKGGRGSATKGQARGRDMENFVESIVRSVFRPGQVAIRCRFTGATGLSTEKADFAIPSALDPSILIEVKAYGATGSKQTDVLGDIARIVEQKRHDTVFILVTDGITWKQRSNDLRKLVALQNEGKIMRIYTKTMAQELMDDLETLRSESEFV
ncbi:MAG: DpnII family type II restriction endonuclease [Verrucomicrobia bacterium]|nr:DpnII family type II restriction endonuclease [Verrucomicrobiota bacterium]